MPEAIIVKEKITIPTYELEEAEKSPLFYELRNHQGTRGNIYPVPMIDKFKNSKTDRVYDSIRLENEYIRIVVLPQLGGRIYEGYDKKADYHFVYKNNVIKPAMIGLCGAWVSGGIEFNWPQHHRPTTFMPVDAVIEEAADGSKTAWMGEIEPLFGMKGMVGVTVYPDSACLTVRTRLYNPTPKTQTFHWWSNLAVHATDSYQLKFPPDIDYITYHYKNVVSKFPVVKGMFAQVDFEEGADITWYRNIPAPASFFIFNSGYNFMGGYDHDKRRGTVHIADRYISPGKKFFTWGNGEFGKAWQRNLTDEDGPYIEIMTGCYTDNQPDFSFIGPDETKTFEQTWFALDNLPNLKDATTQGAVGLSAAGETARIAFNSTRAHTGATAVLRADGKTLYQETLDIAPGHPFSREISLGQEIPEQKLSAALYAQDGTRLVSYQWKPYFFDGKEPPKTHEPARRPGDIGTLEELYLEGLHIEQYRHPTLAPEPYYEEALRRDPLDARSNNAMGLRVMKRGTFKEAADYFEKAIQRLTMRNPNPADSEAYYNLGVAYGLTGSEDKAIAAFRKAAWSQAWKGASMIESARLSLKQGKLTEALRCAKEALTVNEQSLRLRFLTAAILRHMGDCAQAEKLCRDTIAFDPLDYGARSELAFALENGAVGAEEERSALEDILGGRPSAWLELAGAYLDAGLYAEAIRVLEHCPDTPLKYYYTAFAFAKTGETDKAAASLRTADAGSMDYCFASKDREIAILSYAVENDTSGARAPYYLGCLYYARGNAEPAIGLWEEAARRDSALHTAHRCLAMAYCDKRGDKTGAVTEMETAFALHKDARYLFELSQIWKVSGYSADKCLSLLQRYPELTNTRDDLYTGLIELLNRTGRPEIAAAKLKEHIFHPYEGGEGSLVRQHVLAYLLLGRKACAGGDYESALAMYRAALEYPENYHEGRKYRAREAHVYYHMAMAHGALGDLSAREQWLEKACAGTAEPDEAEIYKSFALQRLGRGKEALDVCRAMLSEAKERLRHDDVLPYFAGFPTGLPYEQSIRRANAIKFHTACLYACYGLGDEAHAEKERLAVQEWGGSLVWAELIMEDKGRLGYE